MSQTKKAKELLRQCSPAADPSPVFNLSDSESDGSLEVYEEISDRKFKAECFLPQGFLEPLRPSEPSKSSKHPVKKSKLEHGSLEETKKEFLLSLIADYEPQWHNNYMLVQGDWKRITEAFNERFVDANLSKTQLQDKLSGMKKIYKELKLLSEVDGLTWDSKTNIFQGQEDVWQKLFLKSKRAKKWRTTPWPYYSTFQKLFEGKSADEKQSNASENNEARVKACQQASGFQEIEEVSETIINTPAPSRRAGPPRSALKKRCHSQPRDENDFSIKACMEAFYKLDGFRKEELFEVCKVFKSSDNRELFLSLREEDRGIWLREEMDEI